METVRRVVVLIDPTAALMMLTTGEAFRVVHGIPEEAAILAASLDPYTFKYRLLFEHESFDPIGHGAEYPVREIVFEKLEIWKPA